MNELSALVKSLIPGEKRYFSLLNSHYDREQVPDHLELFHALVRSNETSEKDFLKKHRNKSFARFFAANKHKLWQRVLNALVHYHEEEVLSIRLRKQIAQAELLFYRHFYEEADKLLLKTIDISHKASLHELELDALNLLIRIYAQKSDERFNHAVAQKRRLLRILDEIYQYSELIIRLFECIRIHAPQTAAGAESLSGLLAHKLLQPDYAPASVMAEVGRHSFYEQYYHTSGSKPEANIDHSREILRLLTSNKWITEAYLPELTAVFMNNLSNYYLSRDTVRLAEVLKHAEEILHSGLSRSGYLPLMIDSMFVQGRLYLYNLEGNYDKALKLEKQVMHFSNALLQAGHPRSYSLVYSFVMACFLAGNYRKPVRVLAMTDALKKQPYGDERFRQLNYLLMYCYLKTGNYEMLRSLLTMMKGENKGENMSEAEKTLLALYQQLAQGTQVKMRQKLRALENRWSAMQGDADKRFIHMNHTLRLLFLAQMKGTDFAREWNSK